MANLFKASGGTITLTPTTSWAAPNGLFPTTDIAGTGYTWTSSTSTITLPSTGLADGYLVVAAFEYEDSSNGRHNPSGRFIQASGTGNFSSSASSGYNRDTSEDRSYVRAWGFVDNPSAGATLQFQWHRDTDPPTGGTVRSELQVIPLYYADAGIYNSTTTTVTGGTTPTKVPSLSGTDGTNITIASDVVSVTGDNKRYLVFGGVWHEGVGATRSQRWYGLGIDGTLDDSAKGYAYIRQASDANGGEMFTQIIETSTATRTIELMQYRGNGVANGDGGADVDSATTSAAGIHGLVVLELNDNAEVFASHDSNVSSDLSASPTDLDVNEVTDFNDTASFTDLATTSINAVKTNDYLFGANISAASNNVAATTRWTAFAEFHVNGVEDTDSFAGDYMRNNQSSIDTFGWSANLMGALALTAGDDVGVSVTELTGTEGGGNAISPAGWTGFWGVNLDTLEAAGGDDHTIISNDISLPLTTDNATVVDEVTVFTYYFDASDASAYDPDGVWADLNDGFDGSTGTLASTSTIGSSTSNYLLGEGTNAPSSGDTITQVRARLYDTSFSIEMTTEIYTDSKGELLATLLTGGGGNNYTSYTTLSTPTGGWTWAKLQALECLAFARVTAARQNRVELEVTTNSSIHTITPQDISLSLTEDNTTIDPYPDWNYTYEDEATLGTDSTDLANTLTTAEKGDVELDDNTYFDFEASDNAVKLFKYTHTNSTDNIEVTWKGKTTLAPSSSTVYLQIYKYPSVSTYYFDGSDAAASDGGSDWSNVTNADDGSTSTLASVSVENSSLLSIDGTDAPSSGESITQVRYRVYGSSERDEEVGIDTDGGAENLGYSYTAVPTGAVNAWGSYQTLSIPSGGWSWTKIQALEFYCYTLSGGSNSTHIGKVEIEVTSGGWETLDSDNTTAVDTEFTLTGTKTTGLSNYYSSDVVSARVYQVVV